MASEKPQCEAIDRAAMAAAGARRGDNDLWSGIADRGERDANPQRGNCQTPNAKFQNSLPDPDTRMRFVQAENPQTCKL